MELNIKDNLLIIKGMEKESLKCQMEKFIMEIGLMINSMDSFIIIIILL